MHKCVTKHCRNRIENGRYCSTCRVRRWREKNPEKDAYNNLKSNAKRRRKYFDLTFEQFLQFCREYDYIAGKGRTKTSYSVDCKINELGYTVGNLRVLTVSDNSKKGTKKLEYDYRTGLAWVVDQTMVNNHVENIF